MKFLLEHQNNFVLLKYTVIFAFKLGKLSLRCG